MQVVIVQVHVVVQEVAVQVVVQLYIQIYIFVTFSSYLHTEQCVDTILSFNNCCLNYGANYELFCIIVQRSLLQPYSLCLRLSSLLSLIKMSRNKLLKYFQCAKFIFKKDLFSIIKLYYD